MTKLRGWAMICELALILSARATLNTKSNSRCRHLRQTYEFVNPLWEEWSPVRQHVPLTSWCAFLRWNRVEETALAAAAADGCLQGDCSLTLQTGTTWYYNNKDALSQSETLLFPPRGSQRASTMQSVWEDCHCHWRLQDSQIRFTFTPKHS